VRRGQVDLLDFQALLATTVPACSPFPGPVNQDMAHASAAVAKKARRLSQC